MFNIRIECHYDYCVNVWDNVTNKATHHERYNDSGMYLYNLLLYLLKDNVIEISCIDNCIRIEKYNWLENNDKSYSIIIRRCY